MKNGVLRKVVTKPSLVLFFAALVVALFISGCQSTENKAAVAEMKQRLSSQANSTVFDDSLEKIKFLGLMAATWESADQDTFAQLLISASKDGIDITEGLNSLGDIKAETLAKRARMFLLSEDLTEEQLVTLITSKAGRLNLIDYSIDGETLAKAAKLIENWGHEKFDEVAGLS